MLVTRRIFALSLLAAARAVAAPRRKVLIVLVDGFGPEYLAASEMPNVRRMGAAGTLKTGAGVIPSVTNVNNASLVTGSYPAEHGITTNYQYDRRTGRSSPMESAEFVLRPTIFERAAARGWKTALVSSKDKVRTLCARGAQVAVSAERADASWVERIGRPEGMYTAGVNYWSFRAARALLRQGTDLVYLSTTDYMMHTYPPEDERSRAHLAMLDRLLGEMVDDHPRIEVYLTADHGMNAKREAIDPAIVLREKGIGAVAIPIIRDAHKVHHNNLGGACYVYLEKPEQAGRAAEVLAGVTGIEEIFRAAEAAREFRLHPERIGDLFLLAGREYVFGELEHAREATTVRSHGSRHEARVPLLVYGAPKDAGPYEENLDLTRRLDLDRDR